MTTLIILESDSMKYALRNNEPEFKAEDTPFEEQVVFHATSKNLARELRADLESLLARVPDGYKIRIQAEGEGNVKRRSFGVSSAIPAIPRASGGAA